MDHRHLLDLPPEILYIIISFLEYASEVHSLAQTCRQLSHSANARLYPYWAKKCSPAGIRRVVTNDNVDALRKLLSCGLTYQLYSDDGIWKWSPLALACEKGSTKVVRALLENFGGQIIPVLDDSLTRRYDRHNPDPVSAAASEGHLEALKLLVEAGIPAKTKRAALMWVIRNDPSPSLPIIRYMVTEGGFEMDHKDMHMAETPLGVAAHCRKWDVFKLLVEVGARSSPVTDLRTCFNRHAPILCAAKRNNTEMVQFLLDGPARLALSGAPDADGAAGLAISGRDAIEAIVREQTAPAPAAPEGGFALASVVDALYRYAAASGDKVLVQRLLDAGWEFEVAMKHSPLKIAAKLGHAEVIKAFLESIKGNSMSEEVNWFLVLIEPAIENNDESIVKIVIDYGGKAMMSTCAAKALECSVRHGRKSITALLLQHGALEEVENAVGYSIGGVGVSGILEAAYESGDYPIIEQLLNRNGVGVFEDFTEKFDDWDPDHVVSTAVTAVAYYGPLECFQKILALGAVTMNSEDHWVYDTFRYAVYGAQPEIVRLFLDNGCDVKRVISDEPLLVSIFRTHFFRERTADKVLTIMRLLLDAGLELDGKDSDDRTALSVVVRDRSVAETYTRIIEELLARGADPLTGFESGKSALQMAMKNGDIEILQYFLGMLEAQGYVLGLHPYGDPYEGETGDTPISAFMESEKWKRLFVTRALRQHYWRTVYPIRKKGKEAGTVSAIVFSKY